MDAKETEEVRRYLETSDRSEEARKIRERIPAAINRAEADEVAELAEMAERDRRETEEARKGDSIPDFLQPGLYNKFADLFLE